MKICKTLIPKVLEICNNMLMQRKFYNILLNWKNKADKMCMLVRGARQIGKTYIIDLFGRTEYENYVYINFEENPSYKDIFSGDLDVNTLTAEISLRVKDAHLVGGKTLIFLDEIQNCPQARTALKFFSMDKRYDVIASGSLLGLNYKDVSSYPVGYVQEEKMHSMDFEEFLWALGVSQETINYIRSFYENLKKIPDATHKKMMEYLRQYAVIGGMPQAVQSFVSEHNYQTALKLQRNILLNYQNDIAKYAPVSEKTKARECFLSIPRQLAKENRKFQYGIVEEKGSARKFAGSLMWLYDAGIIDFCYNINPPALPFAGNVVSSCFKIYMHDIGLLCAMLDDGTQKDIIDDTLKIYKGAIYENLIADIFSKMEKPLYYYKKENSQGEIDFFIRYKDNATPIEVKSGNKGTSSMDNLLKKSEFPYGIKLCNGNIGFAGKKITLPLYCAMFLDE